MKTRTHAVWPNQSVSIIVPLFNEEESIGQLHERLLPVVHELQNSARVQLILVDDGSIDATWELLHQNFGDGAAVQCEILQHPVNRGISAAMRTGFKAATGDLVCTMDCDCTYDPEGLIDMIRLLRETRADIITASPYHPAILTEESSRRLFLSRTCSNMYRAITPEKLYCYTSFFRVCRREWARPDMFPSDGFLGVTEYLLAAAYCGATVVEFPAHLGTRKFGRSKMRTLQVIREHLRLMGQTLLLNLRLRLANAIPLALAPAGGSEMPLFAIAEEQESQLEKLEYLGNLRLTPVLAEGPDRRLGLPQHARVF